MIIAVLYVDFVLNGIPQYLSLFSPDLDVCAKDKIAVITMLQNLEAEVQEIGCYDKRITVNLKP